jgi:TRAP-type C4-dicarboxylate transport system permease small subunit
MKTIVNSIAKVNKIILAIASVLLCISVFFSTINAICRSVFSISLPWAEELCTYLVVLVVFLAIPYLEFSNSQLSIGILDAKLKNPLSKKIIYILQGAVIIVIMSILVYYGVSVTQNAYINNIVTYVLRLPRAFFFSVAVASLILVIINWVTIIFFNKGGKCEC